MIVTYIKTFKINCFQFSIKEKRQIIKVSSYASVND